jgi:hypothetical protein
MQLKLQCLNIPPNVLISFQRFSDSFHIVRFEVFTAVALKNAIFWDVMPYGSCRNRHFGVFLHSVHQLLVTANIVPSSLIFVILMMEALCSSKTFSLTRAMQHNIPEDGILPFCTLFTCHYCRICLKIIPGPLHHVVDGMSDRTL